MKKQSNRIGKSKKLSTQLSIIISAMLTFVFTIFILVAVFMSSSALSSAISSDFSNNSEKNAAKVQSALNAAATLGQDMQFYMNRMYQLYDQQKVSDTEEETLVRSEVCGKEILTFNKQVEEYAANTIRAAVSNNPDIMSAGLFFEPYAFDPAVREYALYIQVSDVEKYVAVEQILR